VGEAIGREDAVDPITEVIGAHMDAAGAARYVGVLRCPAGELCDDRSGVRFNIGWPLLSPLHVSVPSPLRLATIGLAAFCRDHTVILRC
jgi:hypothetical protein